ncbi:MAG: site-specific integrase, partial [Patescibacteria group bacterium]
MLFKVDDFLLYLKTQNYSNETIYNYERDLRQFEVFLEEEKIMFGDINKQTFLHYKAYLISRDRKLPVKGTTALIRLGSGSINRNLSSIRNYLKYLIDMDEKVPVVPEVIKLVKTDKKHPQVAELSELIK